MIPEKVTQQMSARFAQAYEALGDAVTVTDLDDGLIFVNSAFEKLYGYSREELLGKSLSVLIPPGAFFVSLEMAQSAAGERWEGEVLRMRKNGERFLAQLSVALLNNEHGETVARIALIRDLTERKRIETKANRLAHEQAVLAEIGRVFNSSLDIAEVYEQFADIVGKLISFDRLSILFIDSKQETWFNEFTAMADAPEVGLRIRHAMEGTLLEEAIRTRKAVCVGSEPVEAIVAKYPGLVPVVENGMRSAIVVPLFVKGDPIGGLALASRLEDAFLPYDVHLATVVGAQIADAVANARLHEALQQEAKEREALAEIGKIISSSLNINEVYELFADEVRNIIPFDRLVVVVNDSEAGIAQPVYISGLQIPGFGLNAERNRRPGFTERLEQTGGGYVVNTHSEEEFLNKLPGIDPAFYAGFNSTVIAPLYDRGRLFGGLGFRSYDPGVYDEHDLELAERIANQIAGAIASARLHEVLQRESRERQVLAEISRIISSSLDINEVFERFAEAVRKVIPFDRFISILNDSDGESFTARYVTGEDNPFIGGPTRRRQRGGFVERIEQTGKGYFMTFHTEEELLENFPGIDPVFFGGFKSLLITPLYDRARMLGVLGFRARAPYAYGERELELAEGVANQVAGAIANSLLYEECRRAEEASRASEANFRGLLESVPDAIVIIDNEGCIRFGNAQAENTFGYAREELEGQSVRLLLPDELQDSHEDRLEEYLRNPPLEPMGVHLAVKARRKDESFFPADIELSPVQSEDELLMIYVIRDVTERNLAEAQLRGSNDQLRALSSHLVSVREEERTRIALEIHDELGQALTAMKMELAWCEKKIVDAGEILSGQLADKVNSMSDLVDTTIESVRRISTELRPPILDNLGLAAAIEWQAQEFESRTGIRCLAHVPETISLDTDRSSAIFRITQEALTNVARHAEATTVHVRLEQCNGDLLLQVEDNGKAITEAEIYDQKSFGLLGMRERAHSLNGQLDVNGVKGKGTTVTARFPVGDVSDNAPNSAT